MIVLNSPSTPSFTDSTEDSYSNRVFTTTIIEENNTFYNEDNYELVNNDEQEVKDKCNGHYDKNYKAHSRESVGSACEIYKF